MKLQNRKTGEIVELLARPSFVKRNKENYLASEVICFDSLAELERDWEDYEEPKNPCFINWFGEVSELLGHISDREIKKLKQIGNYFETEEEAEKAVEKLRAWKRLKDKGFRFNYWYRGSKEISFSIPSEIIDKSTAKDLDLLFGGEE